MKATVKTIAPLAAEHAKKRTRFLLTQTVWMQTNLGRCVRQALRGSPFALNLTGTSYLQPKTKGRSFGGNVNLIYSDGSRVPVEILVEQRGLALYFRDLAAEEAALG